MICTANILVWSCSLFSLVLAGTETEQPLFRFDMNEVEATDAEVTLADSGALRVNTGHEADWPGVTLKAPGGHWDLSEFGYLALDVKNVGSDSIGVFWRIDNPGADGIKNCITKKIALAPDEKKTVKVFLQQALPANIAAKLFGMRGYPDWLPRHSGYALPRDYPGVSRSRIQHVRATPGRMI